MPTLYLKLSGLENHELTPMVIFANDRGQQIASVLHNHANLRGDTYGKGWIRRQIVVPVPQGATRMAVGVQSYSISAYHPTAGASYWIASVGMPGMENVVYEDPALTQWNYFGFAKPDDQKGN
jgi:hypothetical protein